MSELVGPSRGCTDLSGLTSGSRVRPQVLGRRGSRLAVDASHARLSVDPSSGLTLFPLGDVFKERSVILGFGKPNTYLVLPRDGGWDKYNAFMFWRSRSFVGDTKGRVQSGVLFELRGLSPESIGRVRAAAERLSGQRTPSCAWACAHVLADAGFTVGGRSMRHLVRPTKLAARIWESGLELDGVPVDLRVVYTDRAPSSHLLGVWQKELASAGRFVKKLVSRSRHAPAPVFDELDLPAVVPGVDSPRTTIGVARPSVLGAHLGFLFGEQPIFSALIPAPLQEEMRDAGLGSPLRAYPGKLSRSTWVKSRILFSSPVVALMRAHLCARVDTYEDVPASIIPQMLRTSSRAREGAFVYNFVVTGKEFRIKRLENQGGRDWRFLNWLLAKHVLVSNYDPDVRLAGECWAYLNDAGEVSLVISGNSGTYKPPAHLVGPAAELVSAALGVPVEVHDHPTSPA